MSYFSALVSKQFVQATRLFCLVERAPGTLCRSPTLVKGQRGGWMECVRLLQGRPSRVHTSHTCTPCVHVSTYAHASPRCWPWHRRMWIWICTGHGQGSKSVAFSLQGNPMPRN